MPTKIIHIELTRPNDLKGSLGVIYIVWFRLALGMKGVKTETVLTTNATHKWVKLIFRVSWVVLAFDLSSYPIWILSKGMLYFGSNSRAPQGNGESRSTKCQNHDGCFTTRKSQCVSPKNTRELKLQNPSWDVRQANMLGLRWYHSQ